MWRDGIQTEKYGEQFSWSKNMSRIKRWDLTTEYMDTTNRHAGYL